jgi:ACT domain-containing protein
VVNSDNFIIQTYTKDVELREGDVLVRVGNLIDKDRQNTIYLTSSDDGAPYIDFKTGMNEPDGGKVKVRIGNLSGITDNVLGTLSGNGLYAENVYLKGKIV